MAYSRSVSRVLPLLLWLRETFLLIEEGKKNERKRQTGCYYQDSSFELIVLTLHCVTFSAVSFNTINEACLVKKVANSKDSFVYGFTDFF